VEQSTQSPPNKKRKDSVYENHDYSIRSFYKRWRGAKDRKMSNRTPKSQLQGQFYEMVQGQNEERKIIN
jgi:hypothetical protein